MKRLLLEDLKRWKESEKRTPLLIKGARQCGKTYLLKEFGRVCFEDTAYLNFEENHGLCEKFAPNLDITHLIENLGIICQKKIHPQKTLIIFDEIQLCPQAANVLGLFSQLAPEYFVVCASSFSLPSLAEYSNTLTLRPMNFFEFLLACGEESLCRNLVDLPFFEQIPIVFAQKLEPYLSTFFLTGGMPQAVNSWIQTKDISQLETVQQEILDRYELDFARYAQARDLPKLFAIWRAIPEQLQAESRKFVFGKVQTGWRAKDLESALHWLISAGLVYKIAKMDSSFIDESHFKLYLLDIGLLRKTASFQIPVIFSKTQRNSDFERALIENYFLEEWMQWHDAVPLYWKSGNIAQVDFVVQHGTNKIPVVIQPEPKEKALREYLRKNHPAISIQTSLNELHMGEVRQIPLYLLWQMEKYLQQPQKPCLSREEKPISAVCTSI